MMRMPFVFNSQILRLKLRQAICRPQATKLLGGTVGSTPFLAQPVRSCAVPGRAMSWFPLLTVSISDQRFQSSVDVTKGSGSG